MALVSAGLSPLARGNLYPVTHAIAGAGPIPARAGQPPSGRPAHPPWWAYPRSRGATPCRQASKRQRRGLSPLARGNRRPGRSHDARGGPIPARAGQPPRAAWQSARGGAYPRSRGATPASPTDGDFFAGLSPLARGNLHALRLRGDQLGPIPARAGQPDRDRTALGVSGAYPRSRGATCASGWSRKVKKGLSPLARGNLRALQWLAAASGPIPARAGQPQTA